VYEFSQRGSPAAHQRLDRLTPLALPTAFLSKKAVHHTTVGTKQAPAIPRKNRMTMRPAQEWSIVSSQRADGSADSRAGDSGQGQRLERLAAQLRHSSRRRLTVNVGDSAGETARDGSREEDANHDHTLSATRKGSARSSLPVPFHPCLSKLTGPKRSQRGPAMERMQRPAARATCELREEWVSSALVGERAEHSRCWS
jgi:hypothetical protein